MADNDLAAQIEEIDKSLAEYQIQQRDPEITDDDFEKNRKDMDLLLNRKAELRRQQVIDIGDERDHLQKAVDEEMARLYAEEEPPQSRPGDDLI